MRISSAKSGITAWLVSIALASCGGSSNPSDPNDAGVTSDTTPPPADSLVGDTSAPPVDATPADVASDAPGTWVTHPSLRSGPRQETGVAALDGKIYVIGGFDSAGVVVPTVEAYEPATRTWSILAAFPRPIHHANVAAVGGKIYVVGALVEATFRAIGDVYMYDPASNIWSQKASLPSGQERGSGGVATIESKIYVAGGLRGGVSVADFSSYDTASDTHAALPPLVQPTDHLVGCAIGGIVYAIGGRQGAITGLIGRVAAFDPGTSLWTERAPMITARGGAAAAVVRDRIVVAGGEGNLRLSTGVFSEVEVFVPATNSWYSLPHMKTPRHGTGGASIGNTFYVPGGARVQAFGAVADVESIDL